MNAVVRSPLSWHCCGLGERGKEEEKGRPIFLVPLSPFFVLPFSLDLKRLLVKKMGKRGPPPSFSTRNWRVSNEEWPGKEEMPDWIARH